MSKVCLDFMIEMEQVAMRMEQNIDLNLLVDNHGNYLFRYALVKVRNESLAEDLVQETYQTIQTRIWRSGCQSCSKKKP